MDITKEVSAKAKPLADVIKEKYDGNNAAFCRDFGCFEQQVPNYIKAGYFVIEVDGCMGLCKPTRYGHINSD